MKKLKYLLLIQIYQVFIINASKIIQNCQKYQILNTPNNNNNQLTTLCELCEEGYILSADLSQCQSQSFILKRNLQLTYQCLDGSTVQANEIQCSYCKGASNQNYCPPCSTTCQNTVCATTDLYSRILGQCLYYCGNGLLAYSAASCATSQTCQDGLVWSQSYQSCVYPGCGGNVILKKGQTQCASSQSCMDGYYWSQSNICVSCSQQKFYKNMKQIELEDDYEEVIKEEDNENEDQLEKKESKDQGKEFFIENGSAQNMFAKEINPRIISRSVQDIFIKRESTQNMILDKKIQTNNLVKIESLQIERNNNETQNGDTKNQDISPNNINIEIDYN
ncbi:hypothetical protein ABPG72_001799 [Tetrahymena utriculariae]